jgi:hypothetical protein
MAADYTLGEKEKLFKIFLPNNILKYCHNVHHKSHNQCPGIGSTGSIPGQPTWALSK